LSDESVDHSSSVSVSASFDEVAKLALPIATTRRVHLEWPEELVDGFEGLSNSEDLVDHVVNCVDMALADVKVDLVV